MYDYFSLEPKPATKIMKKLKNNNIPFVVFNNNWTEIIRSLIFKK